MTAAADLNVFITETPGAVAPGRRLGIKDLFDTAGVRTTYGSRIYADHVPDRDAEAVRLLLAAGWRSVGKTNLHEFAFGVTSENPWYGPVRNPHDPERVAGGSSGGSAAGLVTDDFDLGLASDTAGSIRIPAAACGVVGFKPSYGAVSLDGCFPLAPRFDHVGPIARTVAGCVEAFAVLTGRAPATRLDTTLLRAATIVPETTQPDIARVVRAALDRLRGAGLEQQPGPAPSPPDAAVTLRLTISAQVHAATFPARRDEYGAAVAALLDAGHAALDAGFDQTAAERALDAWRRAFAVAVEPFDLLLLPTLAVTPPRVGDPDPANRGRLLGLTQPFNFLGWPALSLPCGVDDAGLPVGLQLVGRDDDVVLGAALALEAAAAG